jgi:uncharacterized protein
MMQPPVHEIRDPIYNFIEVDDYERKVIDSWPVQRLRQIHQLAMTYMVYPGATHRRFEHSLGVMHLASQVFDVITDARNARFSLVVSLLQKHHDNLPRWKRTLRMAALCHDIGHLPFSHAAEKELLPEGWDHERLTVEIILSDHMAQCWEDTQVEPIDVAKLAVGAEKWLKAKKNEPELSEWENILSDIITGDAFGVDRMDYLIRDSYHCGVAYGRFDHHRLIQSLRILPEVVEDENGAACIGLDEDGIHSAATMLLARNSMYKQVYLHRVRRAYDLHLKEFLLKYLPNSNFPIDLKTHLHTTDASIQSAIEEAGFNTTKPGHTEASMLCHHKHYKTLYRRNNYDQGVNPQAARSVFNAASEKFGNGEVRLDLYEKGVSTFGFPVRVRDGSQDGIVMSAGSADVAFSRFPGMNHEYVFISRSKYDEAKDWLNCNKGAIIKVC